MYNFSGLIYRIRWQCVPFFLLGVVIVLLDRPWKKGFTLKKSIPPICLFALSIGLAITYTARIISPGISSYTGRFIDEDYEPKKAVPARGIHDYTFWDGDGYKESFNLDIYSEDEVFPEELEQGKIYTVYYDELTRVIVRIDIVEQSHK